MPPKNIIIHDFYDGSYGISDIQFTRSSYYNYKDSYNYYNINVNNILSNKKSDNEYVIIYIDKCKSTIAPLQLKINKFYYEIHEYDNGNEIVYIEKNDEELFKKCREIWNKITELIGINHTPDFVRTNSDDDEFIIANVHENTSFVEGNYENKLLIVLDSVFNNYPQTSLVQVKKHKCIH